MPREIPAAKVATIPFRGRPHKATNGLEEQMSIRSSTPLKTRYHRTAVVAAAVGHGAATLKAWARRGLIPPPLRVNSRTLLWDLDAVLAALAARGANAPTATTEGNSRGR